MLRPHVATRWLRAPHSHFLYACYCDCYPVSAALRLRCWCAPGRLNLIGEPTDDNDRLVLAVVIDKEIIFAVGLNGTATARPFAHDQQEPCGVELAAALRPGPGQWPNYLPGVVGQRQQRGFGSCILNLVKAAHAPAFVAAMPPAVADSASAGWKLTLPALWAAWVCCTSPSG